jgi:16S rRNA (cytosine967-C5)-methyltransferase
VLPEAVPETRPASNRRRPPRRSEHEGDDAPAPVAAPDPFGRWLKLAASVIEHASRAHPADAVLREHLRTTRGWTKAETAQASQAVFSFYRWGGWINGDLKLESQIRSALEFADEFARRPHAFSDAELLARTLPEWVSAAVPVSAAWVRALQGEPALWLRTKPGRSLSLSQVLGHMRPGPWPDSLAYGGEENLFRRPEFHAGEFEIQDIASQAVGLACAPQPGETWWDACAGEGGKLLHLSVLMQGKGLIWASDRAEWRLKKLRVRAARARCSNQRTKPWDGSAKLPTKTRFDGVLLDAPCSGVGTWHRNPHARWTTTLDDVRELAAVQLRLLDHVAPSVKPGGKLIYSVCTLTRAETAEVAAAFQASHPEFTPLLLTNPFHPNEAPQTQMLLWPQATGGGGMFIAGWRRNL